MPSAPRTHQLKQSLLYHIYNRGHNRATIFHNDDDYSYFLKLLSQYSSAHGLRIYHWVLMPNHYHLVVELDEPQGLSSIMAGIGRAYVYYHHRTHKTAGCIWQGRFKSQPIAKELYLTACGRYVERNPAKAGMVECAWDYTYSSAPYYVLGSLDSLTTQSPLFLTFGNTLESQRQNYKEFLLSFNQEEEMFFENLEIPRGSIEFIRRLVKENGRFIGRKQGRVAA